MITTDPQLREFKIQKPWDRPNALGRSAEASAAWRYENSTPPIDHPPNFHARPKGAIASLLRAIPPEETEFNFLTWGLIASKTDEYIATAKCPSSAIHAYTSRWRKERCPTTFPPLCLALFKGVVSSDLYDHSFQVATRGVLPCGGSIPFRFSQDAYSNINDDPRTTAAEMWGEVLKGRLIVFTTSSEPYKGILMESKLAYVTQRDVTNPEVTKTRYISDPRNEVNDRIDNDRHPQCIIPRHQNVARRALYWKRRYPTAPVLLCKRDVKGAFEIIPFSIDGLTYMGCRFAGLISMYLALFFGWRHSPANWGLISTLLMQYVAAFRPAQDFLEGPESFAAYQ